MTFIYELPTQCQALEQACHLPLVTRVSEITEIPNSGKNSSNGES